jgi:hypothetical protein
MNIYTATAEAEQALKEALRELESPKGRVQAGVQKLIRAARMLGEGDVVIWCEIQRGNAKYVGHLRNAVESESFEYFFMDKDIRMMSKNSPIIGRLRSMPMAKHRRRFMHTRSMALAISS